MGIDRTFRKRKLFGNLAVGEALSNKDRYLLLMLGELTLAIFCAWRFSQRFRISTWVGAQLLHPQSALGKTRTTTRGLEVLADSFIVVLGGLKLAYLRRIIPYKVAHCSPSFLVGWCTNWCSRLRLFHTVVSFFLESCSLSFLCPNNTRPGKTPTKDDLFQDTFAPSRALGSLS